MRKVREGEEEQGLVWSAAFVLAWVHSPIDKKKEENDKSYDDEHFHGTEKRKTIGEYLPEVHEKTEHYHDIIRLTPQK